MVSEIARLLVLFEKLIDLKGSFVTFEKLSMEFNVIIEHSLVLKKRTNTAPSVSFEYV